jgi:hypothetical protein
MNRISDVTEYRLEFPRADGSRGFEIFPNYETARAAAHHTIMRAGAGASATVCGVRWNGNAVYMRTFRADVPAR